MTKFFLFFAKEFRKKLFRVNAGNLQDAYERFLQLIFYYQRFDLSPKTKVNTIVWQLRANGFAFL